MNQLDDCTLGIVLTHKQAREPDDWSAIVPEIFIYRNSRSFPQAIKNIIDRQLAFKQLAELEASYVFSPVAIIVDRQVDLVRALNELELSAEEFNNITAQLVIKVIHGVPADFAGKVLPTVWKWNQRGVGRKDILKLSAMETPATQRRIRAKFRAISN